MRNMLKTGKGIKQMVEDDQDDEINEEQEYDDFDEQTIDANPMKTRQNLKQNIAKWSVDENGNRYPVYEISKWKRVGGIRVPVYTISKY